MSFTWPVDRLPATPSYEVSGVVEAVGPDALGVAVGDKVYALTEFDRDGAAADFVLVTSGVLAPKPASLDDIASAAIPMGGLTAWQALFDHGGLAAGERVLIHGAGGGVGHLAVQIAKSRGAHVIAPVAAADVDRVAALGRRRGASTAARRRTTRPSANVDLVFDTAGGDTARPLARGASPGAAGSSPSRPPRKVRTTRGRRGRPTSSSSRSREQLVELARLADAGSLTPSVGDVVPLEDVSAAFERLEKPGGAGGKVVLKVMSDGVASERRDVVVVGGSQAGLAIGYFLAQQGRDFTILEAAAEPAATWRERWESLQACSPRRATTRFRGSPSRATPTATRARTRSLTT